ncbi:tyrosine recombinase XerC [Amycolatopsis sp. NPDC057786]|uniref:site-specific integrase n=1 Tax=Amycolatopsis sp. NPDC057786 TaxID=3346250 RepID=UPI00366C8D96
MTGKARADGEGSIYPHRNGFAAYVWVTTPSGERKRKYVYGKTREEVHEKWLTLHQEAKKGPVATRVPNLGPYLHYWLEEVIRPNRAPKTYVNYELFVRLYINPFLGDKRLDRLQLREAQKWVNKLPAVCQCCAQGKDARRSRAKQRCCALGRCCEQAPSGRTIKDIRDCLRSALNYACREELISRNVVALVTLPTLRKPKRQRWSSDEARKFLESAKSENDPLYAAYALVLIMGMREGEVLGIPDEAINFETSELDISWQLQRVQKKLLHRQTKTPTSDDTMPLIDIVTAALKLRLERRGRDKEKADAWLDSGLVFTTEHGTPIEPRNFLRSWATRCRKAGVRYITVHDGRRSCGSLLADLDVHPRVAMRILRHAQFAVTMEIYTEISSDQTRAALKKLGDSLQ